MCGDVATRYVVDGRVIPQPINPRFKLASADYKREQDCTSLLTEESLQLTFTADSSYLAANLE